MKIGIIGAMDEEISILLPLIQKNQHLSVAHCDIYSGQLNGMDIALTKSGIGKAAAAMATTILIERYQPNMIINTGSAGGINANLSVGDIVLSTQVAYHDCDLTAFGYTHGQMPGCPAFFTADPYLLQLVLSAAHQENLTVTEGIIVSGDSFINGEESIQQIQSYFPDAIAVEMEAASIAHVCYRYNLPFLIIRALSDIANKESHISFNEFLPLAAANSSALILSLLKRL